MVVPTGCVGRSGRRKGKPTMWERARTYYRNRAHQGVYRKGARAYWAGEGEEANPYSNRVLSTGVPTWSAGYYWAWRAGFGHAESDDIVRGE